MRKVLKLPRVIKINEVKGFKVYCAFNNGEHRIIDYQKLFKKWALNEKNINYLLTPGINDTV